jgi:glycogen synthase
VFNDFDSRAMSWALDTALQWYADEKLWSRIVQNAMRMDFSWRTQSNEYLKLFAELLQLDAAALIEGNPPQKAAG